jgi:hypothetical protein
MGASGVQGGISNAIDKKTPQQQTRLQGTSERPQTGVSTTAPIIAPNH